MTLANAPAAALECAGRPGWRSQFGHPSGLLGRLAGFADVRSEARDLARAATCILAAR